MRSPLRAGRSDMVSSLTGTVALAGLSASTSTFCIVDHTVQGELAFAELPTFAPVLSAGVVQGYVRAVLDGLSGTGFTAELWLLAGATITTATLTWTRRGTLA